MAEQYIFFDDVTAQSQVPENGILSRALHNDDRSKLVLFSFAAGQELSAHTAPYPAILTFLKGNAALRLAGNLLEAGPGTVVYMPAGLEHGIQAKSELIMLLTMIKR